MALVRASVYDICTPAARRSRFIVSPSSDASAPRASSAVERAAFAAATTSAVGQNVSSRSQVRRRRRVGGEGLCACDEEQCCEETAHLIHA